jgi:hypothetical protein
MNNTTDLTADILRHHFPNASDEQITATAKDIDQILDAWENDPRPCKGDAFVKAGPRLRLLDCYNCGRHVSRGGKCVGSGWEGRRFLEALAPGVLTP